MSEDVYEKLAKWLVSTFRALPGVDSDEFREVVHLLYTPEEADFAMEIGPGGGKFDELALKTKRTNVDLKRILDAMAKKGTIYVQPESADPLYRPLGIEVPGIFEVAGWMRPNDPLKDDYVDRLSKFRNIYVDEGISKLGKHCTAWCAVGALPPEALPEENIFEFLKRIDFIAVSDCTCRQMEKHMTQKACDCVVECCMAVGDMARWAVEQGWSRRLTLEETIEILKKCESNGQVHIGPPAASVCNCCKHGCINLNALERGLPHAFLRNHFYAVTDLEKCKACGTCVQYCPVNARRMEDNKPVMDKDDCIGCGACVMMCEPKAARMVRRTEEEIAIVDQEQAESMQRASTMSTVDPLIFETIEKNMAS